MPGWRRAAPLKKLTASNLTGTGSPVSCVEEVMWRVVSPAMVAVLAAVLGACRGDGDADPAPDRVPVAPRDPDIVVSVYTTGAEGGIGTRVPDFEMWADGMVFVNGDDPFGIDRYRLTRRGTETIRDLLAGVRPGADYGELEWTDLSTTSVYLNLDGRPAGLSIYGLRSGSDPDDLSGLTGDQVDARMELLDVLSALDQLSERASDPDDLVAEPREPHQPAVFELTLLPVAGEESGEEEPVEWPLDVPLTERPLGGNGGQLCAVIEGDDAVAVAGLVVEPGQQPVPWSTGAEPDSGAPSTMQIQVHGLLPDDAGRCNQAAEPVRLSISPLSSVVLADPAGWDGKLDADEYARAAPLDAYLVASILDAGMEAHRDTVERGGGCEFDADFDYPDGTCHIDGRLQEVPESNRVPTGAALTYYDYRMIAVLVDGERYLDLEARHVWSQGDRAAWDTEAASWRARVDPAAGVLTIVALDD
jgi:hypothetical protein